MLSDCGNVLEESPPQVMATPFRFALVVYVGAGVVGFLAVFGVALGPSNNYFKQENIMEARNINVSGRDYLEHGPGDKIPHLQQPKRFDFKWSFEDGLPKDIESFSKASKSALCC